MLETTCPHCGRRAELEDDRRGRPARCEHCGKAFRAPLHDNEPATATRAGGATVADAVAVAAAVLAVLGMLLTAGALLVAVNGGALPVGRNAIMISAIAPAAVIAVTWLVAKKAASAALVLTGRVAAYLWLLGLVVLVLKFQ